MSETKDALGKSVSRRGFLGTSALAAASVAGSGSLLAACGGGSGTANPNASGPGGQQGGGEVTWGSWANPGEAERFKQYSADYEKKTGTKVNFQVVVGDYAQKIITQLSGGSAPDAFYIQDTLIGKLIQSNAVIPLDDYLASPDAAVKTSDMYENLLEWCKGKDGKLYGLTVDCNPKMFWYNKKLLTEAGVSQTPAQMQEAGTWNQTALDDLLTKVKATGKRGMIIEGNWSDFLGLVTALGGKALDESGQAIFDQDEKSLSILQWMFDHLNAGTMTYGGSLPKGQGVDALFYGSQLATIQYGRWILPNLKKLSGFEYDVAPLPSESGKDVAPTVVYTASMGVNAKAKDQAAALAFTGNFVNADGQRARLAGGGNAVPSIKGLDDIVTEGGLPEHGAYFNEVAANGYTIPQVLVDNPEVSVNFNTEVDKLYKANLDYKTWAQRTAALMNGKA